IVSGACAFYLEEPFRRLTRWLYQFFTNYRISFVGKNFHLFASAIFLASFGFYSVLLYHLMLRLEKHRRVFWAIVTLLTFAVVLSIVTAFDSNAQIMTCTACKDNKLAIRYNDLSYDTIFIVGLVVSLIPLVTTLYKQQKNHTP
ncbi:MAG TPA: hypothetical protein VD794_06515, partial [Flavisolibacter sp.]|nr:hypothetical protein [Flavisolibacter sp.]